MHRRAITREQFDTIAAELTDTIQPGNSGMISGRHEDHGRTVLLRVDGLILASVEDPTYLDALRRIEGEDTITEPVLPNGAILQQAMRARYLAV